MNIDRAAHEAAQAHVNEMMEPGEGWELIQPGQELRLHGNDLLIHFDWLEWLNWHVDYFIRPSRVVIFSEIRSANPEFWQDVARYRVYLPEWLVMLVMRAKYGKDSLL